MAQRNGSTGGADAADGPVVLVTGASAGIGRAVATRFAEGGFRIVAVARGQARLEALAAELDGIGEVAILAGDAADPAIPQAAVRLAMDRFGRLDCLVNNAGSGRWAPPHLTDDAMMEEVIALSLKSPFRFCREALGVMRAGSSIINIGSTWGLLGGLDGGIYCAVKASLVGLTQALAVQYGAQGIRSNLIAPGVIETDMTRDIWHADFFRRINHEMTPFDRDGTVEDVANTAFFLATPPGSYINGQTIALDGGWSTTKYLSGEALAAQRVPPGEAA